MKAAKKFLVGIIMGSDSDLGVMQDAAKALETFGVPYELTVVSAHRTPEHARAYAKNARKRGIKVIIAGAGGAAHLAGVTAAMTTLPVIGVPIKSSAMKGIDSLFSTVQMPPGVPVATVGINGAKNAGILAVQILAVSNKSYQKKLERYKKTLASSVRAAAKKLERLTFRGYLKELNR